MNIILKYKTTQHIKWRTLIYYTKYKVWEVIKYSIIDKKLLVYNNK